MTLQRQINLILAAMPELVSADFTCLGEGWDSLAVDADGRFVFKFPKTETARQALIREVSILQVVRPRLSLPTPDMRLLGRDEVFSCHAKLPGDHLTSVGYAALGEAQRTDLGAALGQFYAELHALAADDMHSAGALPIKPWLTPGEVRRAVSQAVSGPLHSHALAAVDAFEQMPPDPHSETYGYFDGHGWNMAFDHRRGVLDGVYDFADSGFGPLHQDFVYSSFIARDLTLRIVAEYQRLASRQLDMQRIDLLTCYLRLSELAQSLATGGDTAMMLDHVAQWAEATRGLYRWSLT